MSSIVTLTAIRFVDLSIIGEWHQSFGNSSASLVKKKEIPNSSNEAHNASSSEEVGAGAKGSSGADVRACTG